MVKPHAIRPTYEPPAQSTLMTDDQFENWRRFDAATPSYAIFALRVKVLHCQSARTTPAAWIKCASNAMHRASVWRYWNEIPAAVECCDARLLHFVELLVAVHCVV